MGQSIDFDKLTLEVWTNGVISAQEAVSLAAKVLTGEAACEDLPYETIENYGLYINSDAAAELGITIPDDIAQEAQECAE